MDVFRLAERLAGLTTEIVLGLPDLEAAETWKREAAKDVLSRKVRDAQLLIQTPITHKPPGMDEQLHQVVSALQDIAEAAAMPTHSVRLYRFASAAAGQLATAMAGVPTPSDGNKTPVGANPEAVPAVTEWGDIKIDADDLLFLRVAIDEGAVSGVYAKSNAIYRKAVGLPDCPRELRERLRGYGLIGTAKGKGITVLPKGERYAGSHCVH